MCALIDPSSITCACVINFVFIPPSLYPHVESLVTEDLEAYVSVISIFKIVAQGFPSEWKVERSQTNPSKLPVKNLNIQPIMDDLVEAPIGAQRRKKGVLFRSTYQRNIRSLEQEFSSKANTTSNLFP